MKKVLTLGLIAALSAVVCISCGPQPGTTGSTAEEALLRLLPKETRGLVMVDVHKAMTTEAVAKALKDENTSKKYDALVQSLGIDPAKDISAFAIAFMDKTPGSPAPNGAAVINLKYGKDSLLGKLREDIKSLHEETYSGFTIYKKTDAKGATASIEWAFLDDADIAVGSGPAIRSILDIRQKNAGSVLQNSAMAKIIKSADKSAVCWAAFIVPPGLVSKIAEQSPMAKVFEGVTALSASFDYRNSSLIVEIRTMGGTKDENRRLATTLDGLRVMGASLVEKEPALKDLLNGIEITSGAEDVKFKAVIPQAALEKLQKAAQDKFGSKFILKPPETPPVKEIK